MQLGYIASKAILRTIDVNWMNDYNKPNKRYENLVGAYKADGTEVKICVAGATFASHHSVLHKHANYIDFHCILDSCGATLRVHNAKLADEFDVATANFIRFQCTAELLIAHTCVLVCYQMRVLKYLNLLRERAFDDDADINSYTGFLLQTNFADHMVNPPVAVLDHYLYLKSTEYNSGNRNMINLRCHGCDVTASVVRRRATTCTLASDSGRNSVKINPQTFKWNLYDEIPKFAAECRKPLYLLRNKNVLGNGLRFVMLSLVQFVTALRFDKGFESYGFITQEDIQAELEAHLVDVDELNELENAQIEQQAVVEAEMRAHLMDVDELMGIDEDAIETESQAHDVDEDELLA